MRLISVKAILDLPEEGLHFDSETEVLVELKERAYQVVLLGLRT